MKIYHSSGTCLAAVGNYVTAWMYQLCTALDVKSSGIKVNNNTVEQRESSGDGHCPLHQFDSTMAFLQGVTVEERAVRILLECILVHWNIPASSWNQLLTRLGCLQMWTKFLSHKEFAGVRSTLWTFFEQKCVWRNSASLTADLFSCWSPKNRNVKCL